MSAVSATAAGALRTETWEALGTTAVLRYADAESPSVRAAVARELSAIDAAASRFRADSELARVNAGAGARIGVGPLLLEALRLGIRAAEISGGTVDPTLGESLVTAGYDRDWRELTAVAPDAPLQPRDRIVVHRRRTALWGDIELWDDPPSVWIPAGVSLDLGATAKALAADRAAEAAHAAGDVGVLVALGGDIATCGPAPADGWLIRVTDDHRAAPDAPGQTICVRSGAVATSSIVTRRWQHRGRAMHHILDPRHGGPVRTPWRTVSVAAASCADANIAATAAIVLGADAPGWLAEHALPARLVATDGTVRTQGGWPA
ncbi:MAG TPA: FAD:protein FMN transferase [Solirubrobacteraceae bacterium]